MSLGAGNPLAEQLGGGLTSVERIARALKAALGDGGSGPGGDMEDAWRRAKAFGVARAQALEELAFYQAFPERASVHLPVYESILAIPVEANVAERQLACAAAWRKLVDLSVPGLRADLQAIDAGLDIVDQEHDLAKVARFGRMFTASSGASHPFAAFSSHDVLTVLWSGLVDGIPPPAKLERVQALLAGIPAWVDWRVVNGVGFYCDGVNGSRLDLTALGA